MTRGGTEGPAPLDDDVDLPVGARSVRVGWALSDEHTVDVDVVEHGETELALISRGGAHVAVLEDDEDLVERHAADGGQRGAVQIRLERHTPAPAKAEVAVASGLQVRRRRHAADVVDVARLGLELEHRRL